MATDTGNRLLLFRESRKLSRRQLSHLTGTQAATLRCYETGLRTVSEPVLNILKSYFGLNPDWIKTGRGDMYINEENIQHIYKFPVYDILPELGLLKFTDYFKMSLDMEIFQGIKPEDIFMFHCFDNAMSPVLNKGDLAAGTRTPQKLSGICLGKIKDKIYLRKVVRQGNMVILTAPGTAPILANHNDFTLMASVLWYYRII